MSGLVLSENTFFVPQFHHRLKMKMKIDHLTNYIAAVYMIERHIIIVARQRHDITHLNAVEKFL